MSVRACTLLALLLCTTQQIQARPSQRAGPLSMLPYDQDPQDIIYDQQPQPQPQPGHTGSDEMASLVYQMLQRAAQQQEQDNLLLGQRQEDADQSSNPAPSEEEDIIASTDKRGSYMSLCHFKICNMGRKRNLRRSQWGRF